MMTQWGLSKTGYQDYLRQRIFIVHHVRKNPMISLCRKRTPYFLHYIPKNAHICDKCRRAA